MVDRRIEISLDEGVTKLELENGKLSMQTESNSAVPGWCFLSPEAARLLAHYLEEFADEMEKEAPSIDLVNPGMGYTGPPDEPIPTPV